MLVLTRRLALVATGAALLGARGALADEGKPFFTAADLPLLDLLPPPPANESSTTKAEIEEILRVQASRTEAQAKHAIADREETLVRFLEGMGIKAEKDGLPLSTALIQRISDTEDVVTDPAKKGFARPRPPLLSAEIKPIIKLAKSGSYPSGHMTFGTAIGVVLANMMPEKKEAIHARIKDYGESRILAGVHYRSDLTAGQIAGTLIANTLMHNAEFLALFAPAKNELRKALGL